MADEVQGIGFKMADQIAKEMGVEPVSPYRIATGIKYVLGHHVMKGHTFAEKEWLIKETSDVLTVPREQIEGVISDMLIRGTLHVERIDENDHLYPAPFTMQRQRYAKNL